MPFTTRLGCWMPFKSAKRVAVGCSHSRNAAICGGDVRPGWLVEVLFALREPLDERSSGRLARRSRRKEDLCSTAYPLSVGSPRCTARLGFSSLHADARGSVFVRLDSQAPGPRAAHLPRRPTAATANR